MNKNNRNTKLISLMKEGFEYKTLKDLSDIHIDLLHKKFIKEETTQEKIEKLNNLTIAAKDAREAIDSLTKSEIPENEIQEKSVSRQQKLMGLALSVKRGETPKSEVSKDVLDMVDSMTEKELEDFASTKHDKLPKKKPKKNNKKENKEETVRQIEESIVSLIKKNQGKMITKKDILSEQPSIAPAQPKVNPGTKPERFSPYEPKHTPKPKAGEKNSPLPEFLLFKNLNIKFKDE